MSKIGGAAVEQLYAGLEEFAKKNQKDRAYGISMRKQRPITAPIGNRAARKLQKSKIRPSSSVSLPRTAKLDRKRQTGGSRRIYYPPKADTQLSTNGVKTLLPSPVSGNRPQTAKTYASGASDAGNGEKPTGKDDWQRKAAAKYAADSKELQQFEILLQRKHDVLVARIEQHLANALCTSSTTADNGVRHLPKLGTANMFTKIEKNQNSMLEQMAIIKRHTNRNEITVASLSRTVARLQQKVVHELLQFAAVMNPSTVAVADAPAKDSSKMVEAVEAAVERSLQPVAEAVQTRVMSKISTLLDQKLKEHLGPTKSKLDALSAKTDQLLQQQRKIQDTLNVLARVLDSDKASMGGITESSDQNEPHGKIFDTLIYLQGMIRTLGTLAGESIQMGVEDIASIHRRSVTAILAEIKRDGKM